MRERALGLLSWTIFPLFLGGGTAIAIHLIGRGVEPGLAIGGPVLFSYLALMGIERVWPYTEAWLHSNGDLRVDVGHLLVSGMVTIQGLQPFAVAFAAVLAGQLSEALGASLWPSDWSLWAQLPLALVVGEFFMYWIHRLTHEWDWLWRFHALHHSAPRLYFLNAARFHPVDIALSTFSPMIPLVALGASGAVISLFGLVSAIHGLFQHTNLPVRCGPLNWIFSMAELHRWHHSRVLEEANTNFGQNLIVWDVVFGTRYLPADREAPHDVGLADLPTFPMDYWGQLLSPLRWKAIRASSAAAGPAGDG